MSPYCCIPTGVFPSPPSLPFLLQHRGSFLSSPCLSWPCPAPWHVLPVPPALPSCPTAADEAPPGPQGSHHGAPATPGEIKGRSLGRHRAPGCNYIPAPPISLLKAGLVFCLQSVLLLYGTYLAGLTDNVSSPPVNQSLTLVVGVNLIFLVAGAVFLLHRFFRAWHNLLFGFTSGGIFVCTTTINCFIFVPQVRLCPQTGLETGTFFGV